MSTFNDNAAMLVKTFGGIRHDRAVGALTGALDSNGEVLDDPQLNADGVRLAVPYLWVRVGDSRQEVRANGATVYDRLSNVPVSVATNRETGELDILEAHRTRAQLTLGESMPGFAATRPIAGFDTGRVEGRRLTPGRVTFVEGMFIRAERFAYIDANGAEKYWPGTAQLDLTSSIPATSDFHGLVRISLNPDATTPLLVATAGTTKIGVALFQREETLDIAIPAGHISLAVVRLENGDSAPDDNRIWDWRQWLPDGSVRKPYQVVAKTANYTATAVDEIINCDASGGSFTITLPTSVGISGKRYDVRKSDSSGNTVTVDYFGSETGNDETSAIISLQYTNLSFTSENPNWMII